MSARKFIALSWGAVLLSGLLVAGIPAGEAKAGCKSSVTSRLILAHYANLGKQRARTSWSVRAWSKYGFAYRKWSKAANKGYHTNYNPGSYYRWRIRAYGKPCN